MATNDLHHDLRGEMDFDPRQKSYAKHACCWNDSEGGAGVVWREIVVARLVVKAAVRYHSSGELDETEIQFRSSSCAATDCMVTPWVNASVLETPFPSLA